MKQLLLSACLLTLMISCKKEDEMKNKAPLAYTEVPKESHKELYGLWTGTLLPEYDSYVMNEDDTTDTGYDDGPKKITLKINRIHNDSVFGQSIVGGNQRPLKGILTKMGLIFTLLWMNQGKQKMMADLNSPFLTTHYREAG